MAQIILKVSAGPSLEVKGRCVPSENNLFRFPQVGSMLILTRYHREDEVPQERNRWLMKPKLGKPARGASCVSVGEKLTNIHF